MVETNSPKDDAEGPSSQTESERKVERRSLMGRISGLSLFRRQKYQNVRASDEVDGNSRHLEEDGVELSALHNRESSQKENMASHGDNAESQPNPDIKRPQTGYEWIHGASICLAATVIILFLNILLTAIAASHAHRKSRSESFDVEALFDGDCGRAKKVVNWLTSRHQHFRHGPFRGQ